MNDKHLNFGFRNVEYEVMSSEVGVRSIRNEFSDLRTNHSELISGQSGMTLVELILMVVIMGILSAIVIPKSNLTTTSTASVNGAAQMIASDIRYTQEFAMANRISKSINFNAGASVYTFSPTSSLDPSGQLPSGVSTGSNFSVTFNSLGEPITGGGGSITVSGSGQTMTISVVTYTGKVSIS